MVARPRYLLVDIVVWSSYPPTRPGQKLADFGIRLAVLGSLSKKRTIYLGTYAILLTVHSTYITMYAALRCFSQITYRVIC